MWEWQEKRKTGKKVEIKKVVKIKLKSRQNVKLGKPIQNKIMIFNSKTQLKF